jgi:hypothetical protein
MSRISPRLLLVHQYILIAAGYTDLKCKLSFFLSFSQPQKVGEKERDKEIKEKRNKELNLKKIK